MGQIAKKYAQRAQRVFSAEAKIRIEVRKILRKSLVDETEIELYSRTTLPVTRRLRKSIFTQSTRDSIAVGYKGSIAPHNAIRLAKRGASKTDGHDMTMKPAEFIRADAGPKILFLTRGLWREAIQ